MSYAPSPRPMFGGPAHIPYAAVTRHLWGDPTAGEVADWIYVSNDKIHQLVFGLPPGGSFRHSDAHRTIFAADELLYVLSGTLVLSNPETGEVHRALPGEAVFFLRDTWHHGWNYSTEPLRVLEFCAPPPARGTSGAYARPQPDLTAPVYVQEQWLGRWPMQQSEAQRGWTMRVLREMEGTREQPDPGLVAHACVIGLDVGGTKIAGGVVAWPAGVVLVRRRISTRAGRGGEAVLADAVSLAATLMDEAAALGLHVLGIGVGVPELVDRDGNVTSSHAVAWRGVPVQATFSRLAPTVVEADVRAAALAEARFGAGRPYRLFVYLTLGTGISCCLVQDGRPYAGARGNALVLASSPLTTTCTTCGAVLEPVLEEIASGPALVARYNRQSSRSVTHGEEVVAAAAAGDPVASTVVRTAGEALGTSVGWLINVLDPEAVVVGGGLGQASGLYWTSFVAATRAHIWADATRDLPIVPATLGIDAGVVGAAAALIHE